MHDNRQTSTQSLFNQLLYLPSSAHWGLEKKKKKKKEEKNNQQSTSTENVMKWQNAKLQSPVPFVAAFS